MKKLIKNKIKYILNRLGFHVTKVTKEGYLIFDPFLAVKNGIKSEKQVIFDVGANQEIIDLLVFTITIVQIRLLFKGQILYLLMKILKIENYNNYTCERRF